MAKPRKQIYTMDMYLNKMMDKDIRSDADVQRMAGQWSGDMVNELVATVLSDDYIPPIILGEEMNSQLWVIDGLQRSTSFMLFKYGNYKVTSAIDNSVITYRAKAKDKQGKLLFDENGDIIWEEVEFQLKNKTYDELPDELKKRFNEYQIETVIHEECDTERISKLIKRYNNHTAMNTTQKAFTHIDRFAREVRSILDMDFFATKGIYTEKDRLKGNLERVVLESVMCMFHADDWKKQMKSMAVYLNDNAGREEFIKLSENIRRLEEVVTYELADVFTVKDSFVWITLFDKFTAFNIDDCRFADFLAAFKNGLRNRMVDGQLFDTADEGKGTKDRVVIMTKLHILETLMREFFCLNRI